MLLHFLRIIDLSEAKIININRLLGDSSKSALVGMNPPPSGLTLVRP
jgi:hypothetical protein